MTPAHILQALIHLIVFTCALLFLCCLFTFPSSLLCVAWRALCLLCKLGLDNFSLLYLSGCNKSSHTSSVCCFSVAVEPFVSGNVSLSRKTKWWTEARRFLFCCKPAVGSVCEHSDPGNLTAFKGQHERTGNKQHRVSTTLFILYFSLWKGELSELPLRASNIIEQTSQHIRHKIKRNDRDYCRRSAHLHKKRKWTFKRCFHPKTQRKLLYLNLTVSTSICDIC